MDNSYVEWFAAILSQVIHILYVSALRPRDEEGLKLEFPNSPSVELVHQRRVFGFLCDSGISSGIRIAGPLLRPKGGKGKQARYGKNAQAARTLEMRRASPEELKGELDRLDKEVMTTWCRSVRDIDLSWGAFRTG